MAGDLEQAERQAVTRPAAVREPAREALAPQRALIDHGPGAGPAAAAASAGRRIPKLEPGQPYAGLAALAQRLSALGDLPAAGRRRAAAATVYDAELVAP